MKKIIAIALFLGSFTAVQAQEGVRLQVKGSFYSTWLFNKNVSDQNSSLDYAVLSVLHSVLRLYLCLPRLME